MPRSAARLAEDTTPDRRTREAERREAFMRIAARVFREQGLARGTMEQVAAAAGVTKMVLYRRFASKDELIQAILNETVQRFRNADARPWTGYGAGMRRSLAAARSFEDGYILLVRDCRRQTAYQSFQDTLRRRTGARLKSLLWHPAKPPPKAGLPPLLDMSLEPMISFCNDALAYWVEQGDPAQDEHYLRWCAQMISAWRKNACELLNLDSPEQDWGFDTGEP